MADSRLPNPIAISDAVAWYEFLLDDNKLKSHINSSNSEPNAWNLIQQFLEQANKLTADQQPTNNLRTTKLKVLSLQTAALCKWNICKFERELPMLVLDKLIKELMNVSKVPAFPLQDIAAYMEQYHDHGIISIVLYCLWIIHLVIKQSFPVKPGGRTTPVPMPGSLLGNNQQRESEMKDKIMISAKELHPYAIQTLELFLQKAKRHLWIPNYDSLLAYNDCGSGENKGDLIPCEETHAQVCYDLACSYFLTGGYHKANEMFGYVVEWLKQMPAEKYGFLFIDEDKLNGYLIASSMCISKDISENEALMNNNQSYHLANKYLKGLSEGSNSSDLLNLLREDINDNELPMSFRTYIEEQVTEYSRAQTRNDFSLSDIEFDVLWLNTICRAVRDISQPTSMLTCDLNIASIQRIIGFVQQTYKYVSKEAQGRLGRLFITIFNNVFKSELQDQLLDCEIIKDTLSKEQIEQLKKSKISTTDDNLVISANEVTKPDKNDNTLEQVLISTFDPKAVKDTLKKMYKQTAAGQVWKICDKWQVNPFYNDAIKNLKDPVSTDLIHILFAKFTHCVQDEDYTNAKDLLQFIVALNEKGLNKIRKIANNELLRVEILELVNDTSLKFSNASECKNLRSELSDVLRRAQVYLEKPQEGVPSPADLGDIAVALLVNLEHRSFIGDIYHAFEKHSRNRKAHFAAVKLARLILQLNEHLKGDEKESESFTKEAKKAAMHLWDVVSVIFVATVTKSQDGLKFIKVADVPQPLIERPQFISFVKKIRNPQILQLIMSLLVRLLRLCEGDVLIDIVVPFAHLWPDKLEVKHKGVSSPCLSHVLKEIIRHCISCQPHNVHWLRTQGDLQLAYLNHLGALRSYLTIGAVASNYFNHDPEPAVYEDDVLLKSMIKCCKQLKCFTQAAVLCQMTKDVDYTSAIKALQDSPVRSDAMELHYLHHVWDVQLLEHAAYTHREAGEVAKKEATLKALSNPEINTCNTPAVLNKVANKKKLAFFRSMARQHLS